MLEKSRDFNDYDYALVHLFEKYPQYYDFFKESLAQGREVILDNSIFELGTAFSASEFAYWIKQLKPTKYIIPDVLGNAEGTISNLEGWFKEYADIEGIAMGVVQGYDYESLTRCYKAVDRACDEIAICFHYPYYDQTHFGRMVGRQTLIDRWLKEGVINEEKKHHLLGCSLPQEFSHYTGEKYSWINSLDTSNPIIHGMEGHPYKNGALNFKVKNKLADNMEADLLPLQVGTIYYNIEEFKKNLE